MIETRQAIVVMNLIHHPDTKLVLLISLLVFWFHKIFSEPA